MFDPKYKFTSVDRFLKYVKYDTQSDEESTSFPSTEKQKKLSADLARALTPAWFSRSMVRIRSKSE